MVNISELSRQLNCTSFMRTYHVTVVAKHTKTCKRRFLTVEPESLVVMKHMQTKMCISTIGLGLINIVIRQKESGRN